ncbi:hypothetical protein GJAV_G00017070 [Gymnothorax javanicus]|nr:hypothetical protein GJAV_G00017070 [Gymnothorax javanicus]
MADAPTNCGGLLCCYLRWKVSKWQSYIWPVEQRRTVLMESDGVSPSTDVYCEEISEYHASAPLIIDWHLPAACMERISCETKVPEVTGVLRDQTVEMANLDLQARQGPLVPLDSVE